MSDDLFPALIPNRIGGAESSAAGGRSLDIVNPHDGTVLAQLARSGAGEVDAAVRAARAAQPGWAATPAVQRGHILHQICNALERHQEILAKVVALEAGKSFKDANGEAGGAIQCGRFFAGEGQRLFGRTMTSGVPNKYAMTVRQPCGVAGLIIAANTPAPNFAWKVFPALICGNAVVLKTAEDTPISSWLMAKIADEAGLPAGVLNLVHGLGAETGPALVEHDGVDVISFTGSTAVGRTIAEAAGRQLKKVSLELGGKNPVVICDDADLDNAVKWVCNTAYSNAGQRCASGSRFIVMDAVYEAFRDRLVAATEAQKLGVADDCDLGPVINQRQLTNMLAKVEQAVADGAKVLTGGTRASDPELAAGFYMTPTVIDEVDPERRYLQPRALRADRLPLPGQGFRRGLGAGERVALWPDRLHSHHQLQPGYGVQLQGPGRRHRGQRRLARLRAAHAVRRGQAVGQRLARAGHRGPRRLQRPEGRLPQHRSGRTVRLPG